MIYEQINIERKQGTIDRKAYRYVKWCKRCGNKFITTAKTGRICRHCNLQAKRCKNYICSDVEE